MTLYCKRDFADIIKLKILSWEDYFGLSGGPSAIAEARISGRRREESEADEMMTRTQVREMWLLALKRKRDYKPRNVGSLQKPEKARNGFSVGACRTQAHPCGHHDVSPVRPTSDF